MQMYKKCNLSKIALIFVLLLGMLALVGIPQAMPVSANDAGAGAYSVLLYGEVSTHGGDVEGYTTGYVCGDDPKTVEHEVENGWHITAYSCYVSRGVTWYECRDTDDGDYYGWIDANFLRFYDSDAPQETAPVQTSVKTPRLGVPGGSMKGQINTHGGDVEGYKDSYIIDGGSKSVQKQVQNGWHITAYDCCVAYGVTWYECYDTDDFDYYGWIDSSFLEFYADSPVVTTAPPNKTEKGKYVSMPKVMYGQVNTHGGTVEGYKKSYVLDGGSKSVQKTVQNGWHIVACDCCVSYGVTWYECWDSDDSDYYGWIDSSYLDFYDTSAAGVVTTAKPTTIPTMDAAAETQTEAVEMVEEIPTAPAVEKPDADADAFQPTATKSENQSSGVPLLGVIGIVIIVLMLVGIVLILVTNRKKTPVNGTMMPPTVPMPPKMTGNPYGETMQMQTGQRICQNCGSLCPGTVRFCSQCGNPLQ